MKRTEKKFDIKCIGEPNIHIRTREGADVEVIAVRPDLDKPIIVAVNRTKAMSFRAGGTLLNPLSLGFRDTGWDLVMEEIVYEKGDYVTMKDNTAILIVKEVRGEYILHEVAYYDYIEVQYPEVEGHIYTSVRNVRKSTDTEIEAMNAKMANVGKVWSQEDKCLHDIATNEHKAYSTPNKAEAVYFIENEVCVCDDLTVEELTEIIRKCSDRLAQSLTKKIGYD